MEPNTAFFAIESGCIAFFTLEFVTRFACTKDRCAFMKKPMNLIDLFAIMPFYVELCFVWLLANSKEFLASFVMLRVLRLVRVLRVLKLGRYNEGIKVCARRGSLQPPGSAQGCMALVASVAGKLRSCPC